MQYGVLLLLAIPLPIVAGVVKAVWDTQASAIGWNDC